MLKLLARGGIGQVMQAIDTELNREVAVKEIQAQLQDNLSVRERFLREAEITGQLEHPGIVPVYGLGSDDRDRPFYAMRLVRGQSLLDAINEFHQTSGADAFRSIRFQNLLRRFLSVCETISYAHSRGVIHRDIKPENILLGPFGETLVVDWGLAKITQASESVKPALASRDTPAPEATARLTEQSAQAISEVTGHSPANWSVELTQSVGTLVGTPAYMSPEQARGDGSAITQQSDVYSLGATLHMLLTGRPRLACKDLAGTLRAILNDDIPPPRAFNRRVPRTLEAICMKALRLNPAERYETVSAMARDLEHYLADEPTAALPESWLSSLARLTRRNRSLAFSAVLSMMILTCIALAAVILINSERKQTALAFVAAEKVNARLAFDRGYELLESHQFGEGLLWLQRALTHVPKDDMRMRRVILTNMAAARSHLLVRQAVFDNEESLALFEFEPQGEKLLTIGRTGLLRYWKADDGTKLSERQLPASRILGSHIDESGTTYILTALRRNLQLYALKDTDPEVKLWEAEQPADIQQVVVDSQGNRAAVVTRSNTHASVRVLRLQDASVIDEVKIATVVQVFFDEVHQRLICVDERQQAHFWQWHAETGHYQPSGTLENVFRLTLSPDGKWIMVGTIQGALQCYASQTLKLQRIISQHLGSVVALAVSPDNQVLTAAWDNGVARSWNLIDGQPACETLRVDRYTNRIIFRPQTRQLALLARPHIVSLWQLPVGNQASHPVAMRSMESIEYSRDGKLAIASSRGRYAQLMNGMSGEAIGALIRHQDVIKSVCLDPSGRLALTASFDGTAMLWNTSDGSKADVQLDERQADGSKVVPVGRLNHAAFSPDGKIIATAHANGMVKLWDAHNGAHLRTMHTKTGGALRLCFDPSSRLLFVGYNRPDASVRMWEVESGCLLWTGKHRSAIRTLAISPDGRYAVSGGNDATAKLWDVTSGQPLGPELPSRGEVFVARFHPSSNLVATGGYDATIRLWQVPSGQMVGEPMLHQALVTDLTFDASGSRLLSGSVDATARLWDVATCLPLSPPLPHVVR